MGRENLLTNGNLSEDQDADTIVSSHIKLLHSYNEAKDAAQVTRIHLPPR
jgi:hypothetical protein